MTSYRLQQIMAINQGRDHSINDILHSISNTKSLELFCSIAKGGIESEDLKEFNGLTRKQFYSRTSRLVKAGLIKRTKGTFSLTCLGRIVYYSQLMIEKGVRSYWKLKAIDSIKASAQLREDDRAKLMKTILNDSIIESILITEKQ